MVSETQPPSSGTPEKTIFYSLDGIRGVAALLVVMRHTQSLFFPWMVQESYLAVDIFFVLSGVVLAQAYGQRLQTGRMSFASFAWIRLVRIMPLYLLGTTISIVAISTGIVSFGSPRLLAYYVLIAVFMLPNPGVGTVDVYPLNNPCWSLPLELCANGLYGALIRNLSGVRITLIMALSAAGIAFTVYADKSHSLNIGFWARSFPLGLFRVGYSFFAGVLLFRALPFIERKSRDMPGQCVIAWTVLFATTLALTASPAVSIQPYYDFFSVVCVFPCIIAIGMAVQPSGISTRIFRFLGLISYAVYTLHAPLSGLLNGLSSGQAEKYAPLSGVTFLALLMPICMIADKAFDFPVRRRLLRVRRASG